MARSPNCTSARLPLISAPYSPMVCHYLPLSRYLPVHNIGAKVGRYLPQLPPLFSHLSLPAHYTAISSPAVCILSVQATVLILVATTHGTINSSGGPSIYPAWRAQCLSRLASPVFIPFGGPRIYPAWRAQYLIPLGGPRIYPTWRTQYLSRLSACSLATSQAQKSAAFRQRFFSWCGSISDAPFLPA